MEEDKTMYIRIRFGDSHFHFPLIKVAKFIYEYFQFEEDAYPTTEEDLEELQDIVKGLLYQRYRLSHYKEADYPIEEEYFVPIIQFVKYSDILDWDNGESAYIPMFDDGEVTIR